MPVRFPNPFGLRQARKQGASPAQLGNSTVNPDGPFFTKISQTPFFPQRLAGYTRLNYHEKMTLVIEGRSVKDGILQEKIAA
jgi:hypothetical protein